FVWSVRQAAEELEGGLVLLHIIVVFRDHPQGIVIAAGINAFGTAFALAGIDEDSELAALAGILFFDNVEILVGDAPLRGHGLACFFVGDLRESLLERRRLDDLAKNRGVRTLRHAIHATDAISCEEIGKLGSARAGVPGT